MAGIDDFENACKEYSEANARLDELKSDMESEIEAIRSKFYRKVKQAIDAVVTKNNSLAMVILENKDLFTESKTLIFHGVRGGFMKSQDTVEIKKPKITVQLIKDTFDKKKVEELVKITESPVKTAIKDLEADELKLIKCKLIKGRDEVYISTVDSEVDKFINSLIAQAAAIE
ncbi:MAG: host-nuclease inhibitor Gam family protein [Ignavibacteria bacterium]|mgnify:CR=1 FL=1|nr:host-nuclease inhibitor Gam family protein [Ignavibacteria bacterium]